MPHSMTAFARASARLPEATLTWELRSVNHRFLETQFRLPDGFRELEMPLRELLRSRLERGKVDATLNLVASDETNTISIDPERLDAYLGACAEIARRVPHSAPLSPLELLRMPGVVRMPTPDLETRANAARELFRTALESLLETRAREGRQLAGLLAERLDRLDRQIDAVRATMPDLLAQQRRKLRERLAELTGQLDGERLEQELAYLAQRADVDEEMDRMATHGGEFRRVLAGPGPVGRRLDFLAQELNREANTLGSKALGTAVTQAAVEMKVLIEQLREQVQNLE